LVACTCAGFVPEAGYRVLMLGWSAAPLVWVLAAALVATRSDDGYLPPWWVQALTLWVPVASGLGVILALKAALVHDDLLLAALATALACPALAGLGVWRREEGWAFAAGLGVNLAASLVVCQLEKGVPFLDWCVLFVQANIIATSAVALLWLALRQLYYGRRELSLNVSPLLALQVMLAATGNFMLLFLPAVSILADPGFPLPSNMLAIGAFSGWLAFVLSVIALGWYGDQVVPPTLSEERISQWTPRSSLLAVGLLAFLGLGVGSLSACLLSGVASAKWIGFHTLLADWVIAMMACVAVAWWLARLEANGDRTLLHAAHATQAVVVFLAGLVVALALRGTWSDPFKPYWSMWAVLCVALVATALACWTPRRLYVFASGLLLNLAAFMMWVAWGNENGELLFAGQALACVLAGLGWSTWHVMTTESDTEPGRALRPLEAMFTRASSIAALAFLGAIAGEFTLGNLIDQRAAEPHALTWFALAMNALLFGVRLWHDRAREVLPALFTLGIVGIALGLDAAQLDPRGFCQLGIVALAAYATFTSLLTGNDKLWEGMKLTGSAGGLRWFVPAQLFLAPLVIAGGLWLSLDFATASERFLGAIAIAILIPGIVRLAQAATGKALETFDIAEFLRYFTLGLGAIALGAGGWALVEPAQHASLWIGAHRTLVFLVTLSFVTVLYGVVLSRRLGQPAWANDCRNAGPIFGLLALFTLLVVLGQEALLYRADQKMARMLAAMKLLQLPADFQVGLPIEAMGWLAVSVISLALVGLIVAGIAFAVAPEKDPFGLSERGRMWYVYGAELVALLLFLHFKITREEMFRQGVFIKFWPFLVLGLAFVGAGLGEFFARRKLPVLAEPFGRTGMFLPLLPVLAFWVMPASNYANLWFTVGLLYGLLATSRRSFAFGLLAALSANMGLWVLLFDRGLLIWEHPQLWLIPPALITLASEHINRARLTQAQSASLRYAALLAVYVSSTADMFIAGLGESWLLPMVLVSLSVGGILLGMILRIRAFLLLGSSFLTLVVFTMIWYAGVERQQMWIVYAFGIVLGAAILTLFGIFEKRRNDVLRVLDDLKRWR
ncbi:MAG: hypothetical protein AB7K24_19595, partial [Gemmataceae bacterium]